MNSEYDQVQKGIMRALRIREYLETQIKQADQTINTTAIVKWLKKKFESDDTIARQTVTHYLNVLYDFDEKKRRDSRTNGGLKKNSKNKYVYEKLFTTEQLDMLCELVYSTIFIDDDSAYDLVTSLAALDNKDGSEAKLNMESVIRPYRAHNICTFANLATLHEAIRNQKKITYYKGSTDQEKHDGYYVKDETTGQWIWNYYEYSEERKKYIKYSRKVTAEQVPEFERENAGIRIEVSPYKIVWDNSHCYLIGGNKKDNKFEVKTFRIDRMFGMEIKRIDEKKKDSDKVDSEPVPTIFYKEKTNDLSHFDAEKFMSSVFSMWAAQSKYENVRFRVKNTKLNIMRDRFGESIRFIPVTDDAEHYEFTTGIQVTNTFFSWLTGFDPDDLQILYPPKVRNEYLQHLQKICAAYENQDTKDKT